MNFKVLVKAFSFIGWIAKLFNKEDYGYIGDCKEITKSIPDMNGFCRENLNGQVIGLYLNYLFDIGEENIKKMMTYDTVEELYISNPPKDSNVFTGIPNEIGNLKNLKYLTIDSIDGFNKNDTTYLPASIKELSLLNINHLTQDDINGFENLTNLESLFFSNTCIKEGLDFKPVENLEKLKKLKLYNFNCDEDKYSSFYYLDHFKNVEKLSIEKRSLTQKDLENISKLPSLKELVNIYSNTH